MRERVDLSKAKWRKSRQSANNGGDCVEVAGLPGLIAIRDSKDPGGPTLTLSPETWRTFTEALKNI
jgi:Domain of unknown function (DUF397)